MSTYIFAIGGSGARVLRSLTMLLASGCKGTAANNEIIANIIDYDSTNGDTNRTQKVMETYHYLHNNAYMNGDTDIEQFFCNPLLMLRDKCSLAQSAKLDVNAKFDLHLSKATTNQTFANYIGYGGLGVGTGNNETRQLLESLYDTSPEKIPGTMDDNPKAELRMNLHKGFKGCPNLGCIVTKHLKSSPELNLAVNSLIQPTDKIVIIGSLFGGTGASGIPMLLDLFESNPNTQAANKAVIALLPYFNVAPPDANNKSAVNSNTFIAKTKAAISAYQNIYNQANCFYFVGDEPQNVFANVDGMEGQKNDAHYVELASAMCILDFINQNINGGYEVGLQQREDNKVDYYSFYQDETIIPYIHPMARFKLFSAFCKNYLLLGKNDSNDIWLNGLADKGCKAIGDTSCANYRQKMNEFIDFFDKWNSELSNPNSHRPLILFNETYEYKDVWNYKKIFIPGRFLRRPSWELTDKDFTKPLTVQYNTDNPAAGGIPNRPEYLFWRGSKKAMNEIDEKLRNKKLL